MRIAIVQFPGSNCERETMQAVRRAGMEPVAFLWNQPAELLGTFDGYIIVGGFSYEDRSRSGVIAALDPVMKVIAAQSELGKPVLGICNGAQILVEAGLVPGLRDHAIGMALTDNKRLLKGKVMGTGFYNAWVQLRLSSNYQKNAFTQCLTEKDILSVPIAHAEGRFVMSADLLAEIKRHGLNVFQYCNPQGEVVDEFPVNPNGSVDNIAAISNKQGNVMAIMPHPERTTNGDAIFRSMRDYIANDNKNKTVPLQYEPKKQAITPYFASSSSHQLIVELVITDNHAMSVNHALARAGLPVNIKRFVHWEIECDSKEVFDGILQTGVLYNDRKEVLQQPSKVKAAKQIAFLVRAKDDMQGQQKKQMLERHFKLSGIRAIHHSVIWCLAAKAHLDVLASQVIHSSILYNPYAHDCYYY